MCPAVSWAQTPQINSGGIVNSASFLATQPSAGTMISIFGTNLATGTAAAGAFPLPTNLLGTQVLINGQPMSLFFVSPLQINAQVPLDLGGQLVLNFQVVVNGAGSNIVTIVVTFNVPGIFTTNQQGTGQGAIVIANSGGALAAPPGMFPGSRRVLGGEFISIYCTGLGKVSNPPGLGQPA